MAVEYHVNSRQRIGGIVHLLAVDGDAVRRLVGGLEQKRAGAARGVVDGLYWRVSGPIPTTFAMTRETSDGV